MPAAVVSAVYGGCAAAKCAKLRQGDFWEHCVEADEEFAQVVKSLYGENRADRCVLIMKGGAILLYLFLDICVYVHVCFHVGAFKLEMF